MDLDQARHFVRPDLGPNCLQRLSADDTSRQMGKGGHKISSDINSESKKGFVVKVEIPSNTLDPNVSSSIPWVLKIRNISGFGSLLMHATNLSVNF